MRIEGSFVVAAPQGKAWRVLNDVAVVAACVPGCESVERLSELAYRAVVVAEIGIIKARFNMVIEITRTEPPRALYFSSRGEEGSRASMLMSENSVVLDELGAGETRVSLTSDVSVTGRLGKFGLGVMKKKSESMTRVFAESLRLRLVEAAEPVELASEHEPEWLVASPSDEREWTATLSSDEPEQVATPPPCQPEQTGAPPSAEPERVAAPPGEVEPAGPCQSKAA
jgi:carbon monoxide dehydrogenase subunit G